MPTQADALAKIASQQTDLNALVAPITTEVQANDSTPILNALAGLDAPIAALKALVPPPIATPPAS